MKLIQVLKSLKSKNQYNFSIWKKGKVCFANTKTIVFIFAKPSPSKMEYIRKLMLNSWIFSKSYEWKNEKDRIKKNDCLTKDKKDKQQVFILTIDERLKLVKMQSKIAFFWV